MRHKTSRSVEQVIDKIGANAEPGSGDDTSAGRVGWCRASPYQMLIVLLRGLLQ